MVFDMVDAIVRRQNKRAADMPGGYRGYLIMTPRDLFSSIAQHWAQAAPTVPVVLNAAIPHPGMPPQQIWMPGWPAFAHVGGYGALDAAPPGRPRSGPANGPGPAALPPRRAPNGAAPRAFDGRD
jgi:hypothetical protein